MRQSCLSSDEVKAVRAVAVTRTAPGDAPLIP